MSQKLLIVEDSKTIRSLIISTLDGAGDFEFTESVSGFEALKVLPREKFDLIITDINMPDINGLELVSFIKKSELYKNIPLFIISTERSEQDVQKGLNLGANEYIVKPFDPDKLIERVQHYLKT
ncbi:MAG: response regulator [Deltaproteobacteria bacterium]|nr:response regulator [Deltaproteobacteria bacterium]